MKIGSEDQEAYRQLLEAKLQPDRIRATLGFAGLYQMTHELIKTAVLEKVRDSTGEESRTGSWSTTS